MSGFTCSSIILGGKFTLIIEIETAPYAAYYFMGFLIVDNKSTYHEVLERQALKELWTVKSIHHLCIKFRTKNGIVTVRGDQMGTSVCYLNSLRKSEPQDVNVILVGFKIDEVLELGRTVAQGKMLKCWMPLKKRLSLKLSTLLRKG